MVGNKLKSIALALAFVFSNCLLTSDVAAQAAPASDLVLVLPFENTSNFPEYNWIGESFADSLSALLNKPGLRVISSDERALAYQRLRLPLTVLPSRATAIKLAREAKATMIVVGTYGVTPPREQDQPPDKQSKNNNDKTISTASVIAETRDVQIKQGSICE